jgi:hypothetical protein
LQIVHACPDLPNVTANLYVAALVHAIVFDVDELNLQARNEEEGHMLEFMLHGIRERHHRQMPIFNHRLKV